MSRSPMQVVGVVSSEEDIAARRRAAALQAAASFNAVRGVCG